MRLIRPIVACCVIAHVSCSTASSTSTPRTPKVPAVTETGTPTGATMTTTIGSGGGSLTSGDGLLTLTIPAGAVSSDIQFSVTPITATGPGAVRAYRVGPEGTTFSSPATLSMKYTPTDIAGSSPQAMFVAYQTPERTWKAPPRTVNEATQALEVSTSHLSDWTEILGSRLLPPAVHVKVGGTVDFRVEYCDLIQDADAGPGVEPTVSRCEPETELANTFSRPAINGVPGGNLALGTVASVVRSSAQVSTYTAPPAQPTPNPVQLSVYRLDPDSHEKTILVSEITVDKQDGPTVYPAGFAGTIQVKRTLSALESFEGNGQFEVHPTTEVGGYEGTGTFTVSSGNASTGSCDCTISGGTADLMATVGVNITNHSLSVAASTFVNAQRACTPKSQGVTCPPTYVVSFPWGNTLSPSCQGTTANRYPDDLSGQFHETCGSVDTTVTWSLTELKK